VVPDAEAGGRLPKCTPQQNEVKLVIRLKLGLFTDTLRLRSMPPRFPSQPRPFSGRIARRAAFLAAVLVVAACDDGFRDNATFTNVDQPFTVAALSGSDISAPAGLSLASRSVVRIDGVFDFDLAFDINRDGKPVILPVGFVGTPLTGTRTIGLLRANQPFTRVEEAPRSGYVFDSTMTINPGAGIVVLYQQSACSFALTPQTYAKVTIDSVSMPRRTLYGRVLVNLNCGKRQLTPGLPTF
jgi:hypothetical protein